MKNWRFYLLIGGTAVLMALLVNYCQALTLVDMPNEAAQKAIKDNCNTNWSLIELESASIRTALSNSVAFVQYGTCTNWQTVTFPVAYSAPPAISYSWIDAITSTMTGLVASVTSTATTVKFDAPTADVKNMRWIAVGTK